MLQISPEFFSPEDFIEKYKSWKGIRNQRIASVLEDAVTIIPFMQKLYPNMSSDIQIRISDSTALSAQGGLGSIVLSLGMIEHCIAAPCMPIDEICPAAALANFDHNSLAAIALAWIIAHEYFHIAKRHTDIAIAASELKDKPYANSIDSALEHDADLMAVAAIYRLLQLQLRGAIHDLDVRRIAIHTIFFTLRTFPQGSEDDIHSAMPERLYHLYHKLVWLTQDPNEEFSSSGLTDHSRERIEPLLNAFVKCEHYFQLLGSNDKSNLLELFSDFRDNKRVLEIVNSWHWIRPTAEKINGAKTSAKYYKSSNFNPTCVFCGDKNTIKVSVFAPWITTKLDINTLKQSLDDMAVGVSLTNGRADLLSSQTYVRESKFDSKTIDRICAPCKNNWFDPLDSATRPLIETLIDGGRPSIDDNDAKNISIYMCVIAVLQEYTDPNPKNRLIPATYKKKLRKNKIPSNWVVAIRPMEKSSGNGIWSRYLLAPDGTGYTICSVKLGCFYAQLVCLLDFEYPLYFERSKFLVTNPPRGQTNYAEIQILEAGKLYEPLNKLHDLMTLWASNKTYETNGKKKSP